MTTEQFQPITYKKTPVERFNELLQQDLQETEMPRENIPFAWYDFAGKALQSSSPMSLGLSPVQFKELFIACHEAKKLTLLDFSTLANNLESKSANDLGYNMNTYLEVLLSGAKAVQQWNEIVNGIRERVQKQVAQELVDAKEKKPVVPLTTIGQA
jgi:hypothetical protein